MILGALVRFPVVLLTRWRCHWTVGRAGHSGLEITASLVTEIHPEFIAPK